MMNKFTPVVFLAIIVLMACEPNNPFAPGPVYDFAGNLAIDRKKIDAFLDTARIDSLYRIHDPSGVVVIVQSEGSGTRPTTNTVVYTNYTGSLMEGGSVFDTNIESVARENNIFVEGTKYITLDFRIGTGEVITGWDTGFRRLRPGSKAVFVIPSPWAYRDQANSDRIPANSVLLFDIDFLGID